MKGKHILFLAIPAMMLASCGGNLGTEVTDSSAINDMLSNVATKSEDVKNFKFVVDMNGTSYDKEAKKNVTSKSHIVYECNEDEEVHCKTESVNDKLKQDIDYYLVKNPTYQQVMYVDTYEDEDNTDSKNGVRGNENYFKELFYGFRPSVVKENVRLYLALAAVCLYSVAVQVWMPYLLIYLEHYMNFNLSGTVDIQIVSVGQATAVSVENIKAYQKLADSEWKSQKMTVTRLKSSSSSEKRQPEDVCTSTAIR